MKLKQFVQYRVYSLYEGYDNDFKLVIYRSPIKDYDTLKQAQGRVHLLLNVAYSKGETIDLTIEEVYTSG